VKATGNPQGGDDAVEANWYDLNSITKLAGDHFSMVNIVGNK
jgi:hypothetical protein